MPWFYASSVSVTNGATVVSVNTGDDISLAQNAGGLVIGAQPPVEIKRTYVDGSNNKKIELLKPWPYGNQTNQPALAFPTDGDLAAATAVLKQLIDGFTLATQAEAQSGTENTKPMTALRVKQAMDAVLGSASKLTATTGTTDATQGRALRVGDFGAGLPIVVSSVDFNAVQFRSASALFYVNTPGANAPPTTANGWLQVRFIADGFTNQEYIEVASAARFTRTQTSGVWSPWVRVYTGSNILGIASQFSGVPTGAIIQRGGNANGYFTRFADGTQLARAVLTSASGGGRLWTFPITFGSSGQDFISVTGSTAGGVSNHYTVTFDQNTNASVNAGLLTITGQWAPPGVVYYASAYGPWFPA